MTLWLASISDPVRGDSVQVCGSARAALNHLVEQINEAGWLLYIENWSDEGRPPRDPRTLDPEAALDLWAERRSDEGIYCWGDDAFSMRVVEQSVRHDELDLDTATKGLEAPFDPWEHDHTGLVHVLWDAQRQGLTLDTNADALASLIMSSRWLRANRELEADRG